ncbi:unnamed protein product [Periconia digitata]|uniref:DUF7707 domain-containing protein n=1 Tax=Periconia digitata TaxID=1303443 RepID=A0A9W4U531_9PLEO|nr:unnamed protein product [Periconia digitata]
MRSSLALSLLAAVGFVAAQEQYTIDPNSVPKNTRDYWCKMSKTQCPLICLQQPGVKTSNTINNDCDADALTYACTCDNNVSPNITMYTQTLPYFICTEWGTQCRKDCGSDNTCADKCTADHPCGASEPFKGNASASASASGTPSATSSGSGGADSTAPVEAPFGNSGNEPERNAASTLTTFGATYGMAMTLVGVFAGVALL